MEQAPRRYSTAVTVLLLLLLFVSTPFAFMLAIVLFPPWCALAFYCAKRIWKSGSAA